jgi:hypothetical protein
MSDGDNINSLGTFEITDFNMYDKDRKTQVVEKTARSYWRSIK